MTAEADPVENALRPEQLIPLAAPTVLDWRQRSGKRAFDLVCAVCVLLVMGWLIPLLIIIARRSSGGTGLFRQTRVGRDGRLFEIVKLRTMRLDTPGDTTVTTSNDPRITSVGRLFRRTKLDELPQLINVVKGEMSLVGPRPDVPEFVPTVGRQAEIILSVRPGITGPATLVFRDEELLLAVQPNPETYNLRVLLPTKARINEYYVESWRFRSDLRYLWQTLRGVALSVEEAMQ